MSVDTAAKLTDAEKQFAALCGMTEEEYGKYRDLGRPRAADDADAAAAASASGMTPEEYAAFSTPAGARAWLDRDEDGGTS